MDITELKRTNKMETFSRHPWERARARALGFWYKKYPSPNHIILDLGSGDAYALSKLADTYPSTQMHAVDEAYSEDVLSRLRPSRPAAIRFHRHLDSFKASSPPAGTCLLMDVLEHCEDDRAVLESCCASEITCPGALFIITVPAYQSLFSSHDRLLQHHRRYSRRQMEALCLAAGLNVLKSGYFFFSLLPPRWLTRRFEKMGRPDARQSLDAWKGGSFRSRLFYTILWADFRLSHLVSGIGIRLPGLSAYCICRKPL